MSIAARTILNLALPWVAVGLLAGGDSQFESPAPTLTPQTTTGTGIGSCQATATKLCLNESRFEVVVSWQDFAGNTGTGHVVANASDDSGLFWFFKDSNWELLVKVLDGCPLNDHVWVFSAATTNVAYTLTVTDSVTGASRDYTNTLGVAAPAVTDTQAFPCDNGGGGGPKGVKILPPPGGGMYIGQWEWTEGDIATFEATAGRHAALWSADGALLSADAPTPPEFDPQAAQRAWDGGRLTGVVAWGGSDLPLTGFSIDRVLSGELDVQLSQLAAGFRQFGKPMIFESDREPNGIGTEYMGGFGTDGTETMLWALEHNRGLSDFDPSGFPHPELYANLGDPKVCDGVERLVALHRYYYDFFVNARVSIF